MNFWDKLGRLHTKEVTDDNQYPTNNPYIYTGYYKVLHPVTPYFYQQLKLPEQMPFSRHPDQDGPPISHDEITGVCILSQQKAKDICAYLKENNNQCCDLPGFSSRPLWKLNPFKVAAAFKKLNKELNPRKATINYPEVWNVAFWQRPEYRWVYKRCAGITPSLFEKLYFLAARAISVIKWKKEDPNLLLFFSLKHLKQQGNLGIEGHIAQMHLNSVVGDMYDDINDMLKHATKDLPAEYFEHHPWTKG